MEIHSLSTRAWTCWRGIRTDDGQGFGRLGYLLFWVAVIGYVVTAGLVIVRLSLYPEIFFEEHP